MITIYVYGAEEKCASCVNLPSSQETASWLSSALARNYGDQIQVNHVDIYDPKDDVAKDFSQRVIEEELWYPVVVVEDEIISEGVAKLKNIRAKLESLGLAQV